MKSDITTKNIILMTFGIILALSTIIIYNLDFNIANYNNQLKVSQVSLKIHIIGNSGWADFRNDGNCTGSGTISDPFVIQDLVIDAGGSGSGILIENSDVYFKIENCTVYNSGGDPDAGIKLIDLTNGKIINNNCSFNYIGVYLEFSPNNNISGNTVNNNNYRGILLDYSSNSFISGNTVNNNNYGIFTNGFYNTISGNTANDNIYGIYLHFGGYSFISGNTVNSKDYGIYLHKSDKNKISGNTASNSDYGIYLYESNRNNIWGNTLIGNTRCIVEEGGEENTFSDNGSCTYGEDDDIKELVIPGYSLFFLLVTLSIVAIFMRKNVGKSLIPTNFKNNA